MDKIIFLLSSLNDSRANKRVLDFIGHGYTVEVYAFHRNYETMPTDLHFEIQNLGGIEHSYVKRLYPYVKQFRKIVNNLGSRGGIFYLMGLDIAMAFYCVGRHCRYIYEECDLTYTYMRHGIMVFDAIDKYIIRNALLHVSTSEGFLDYHFGARRPDNICLVENKLDLSVTQCEPMRKKSTDISHLSIGFVGVPRFKSIYNFIDVFCHRFPQYEFHLYGGPLDAEFERLRKHKNCSLHGRFKTPVDLPAIYSSIDMVIAAYDAEFINVKYAEPNKIYEAIYFETPIVVSSGTFLAEKVKRLGIGYDINAMDETEIENFINNLSEESLQEKKRNIQKIDKTEALSINDSFFERLNALL